MSDNGFRKIYENKSTDELLDIVTNKRDDYNKNAIADIEMILGYFGSNSANHFGVIVPAISVQIVPL